MQNMATPNSITCNHGYYRLGQSSYLHLHPTNSFASNICRGCKADTEMTVGCNVYHAGSKSSKCVNAMCAVPCMQGVQDPNRQTHVSCAKTEGACRRLHTFQFDRICMVMNMCGPIMASGQAKQNQLADLQVQYIKTGYTICPHVPPFTPY